MATELNPCPFCGSPGVEVQYNGPNEDQIKEAMFYGADWDAAYFVACWCGSTGPERADEDAAILAWNTRPEPAQSLRSQAGVGEAVAWVSHGQLEAHEDPLDPDHPGGNYLPVRKTKMGNFDLPLFARPAPIEITEDREPAFQFDNETGKTRVAKWWLEEMHSTINAALQGETK